jgi:hypothetical protein
MIPDCNQSGELPPGIYETTLQEIQNRYGYNRRRRKLLKGLEQALNNLRAANVTRVYINGSFITTKKRPGDIDGCWETEDNNVDRSRFDPVLLDFSNRRKRMKKKYGVEFFPAEWPADLSGTPFIEFFQTNRENYRKGILMIQL